MNNDTYGPKLPPNFLKDKQTDEIEEKLIENNQKIIGPALPPNFIREKNVEIDNQDSHENVEDLEAEVEEEEEVFGPLPPDADLKSHAHQALEERALNLKLNQFENNENMNEKKVRENWMLELPEIKAPKLGKRTFRQKTGPDLTDRSIWTRTPQSKTIEKNLEENTKEIDEKNVEQMKMAEKYAKKRTKKSLLEIHQKKSKINPSNNTERRSFNRDIDLNVNHFDSKQKEAILKKAQLLDDRFSAGHSKYL